MIKDWKMFCLSLLITIGMVIVFRFEYELAWHFAVPLGLLSLLLYPIYLYEMGKWDKAITNQRRNLELQERELEAVEKVIAAGEKVLDEQEAQLVLLKAKEGYPVEPASLNERALNALASYYFKKLDQKGTKVH